MTLPVLMSGELKNQKIIKILIIINKYIKFKKFWSLYNFLKLINIIVKNNNKEYKRQKLLVINLDLNHGIIHSKPGRYFFGKFLISYKKS